jgi:predicted permease
VRLLRRFRYLLQQRQRERDLAEEIDFHRALAQDPRQMGNLTRSREDARAVWIWPWLQSVWQDAVYALRSLRRQPGFTIVALLTLGMAIGFNTSFFTVFNALALRPWPVKDPSRVVIASPQRYVGGFSLAEVRYLAEQTRLMSGLVATDGWVAHLGFEGFGKSTRFKVTTASFFSVLGISMEVGRGFLPEEDRVEAPAKVAVLSYGFWRDHFGADPQVVGREVPLDGIPFTIVGVASRNYTGIDPSQEALWIPFAAAPILQPLYSPSTVLLKPDYCCLSLAGRLAPGVSRSRAEAELTVLSAQFRTQFHLQPHGIRLSGTTFFERPGAKLEILPVIALMFLGLTLVFLLACANVGNLLVARAAARQSEIAMRRSLGASRGRIVRQLLTESFVLALGACALGVTLAFWLPNAVAEWAGQPAPFRLVPDSHVLFYALAMALLACLTFGLAPALQSTRPQRNTSRFPLRSVLLATQVAISILLLIGAGLLLDGIQQARHQDPGFAVADVSVISFELPAGSYEVSRTNAFYTQLLNSLKGAMGTEPFGIARHEPLSGVNYIDSAWMPAHPQPVTVIMQEISSGYFGILRIPILAGRNLEPADAGSGAILVNQTLARAFSDQDIGIGKTIMIGRTPRQIVGIVKDTYSSRLDRIDPIFYQMWGQGASIPKVLVRPSHAGAVAAAASAIDKRVRTQALPLSDTLELSLASSRTGAEIAGMLGAFALILATVGMSGVFAYVVRQRTKEIGIRIALGARPAQVIRLVLAASSRAIVIGLAAGFLGAIPIARLMQHQLFGVSPFDPLAYLSVAFVFAAAALAASYAPARRASRVDPSSALRYQ